MAVCQPDRCYYSMIIEEEIENKVFWGHIMYYNVSRSPVLMNYNTYGTDAWCIETKMKMFRKVNYFSNNDNILI